MLHVEEKDLFMYMFYLFSAYFSFTNNSEHHDAVETEFFYVYLSFLKPYF